jgi:probable O-glycosylation ligase (exosortase A-associated)
MPAKWLDRVQSMRDASQQTTFLTRLDSWSVAYRVGLDHPWLGGGFGATENADTYKEYSLGVSPFAGNRHLPEIQYAKRVLKYNPQQIAEKFPPDYTGGHAVHDIYLQVLADLGFPGLILFLLLLAVIWLRLGRVKRLARDHPEYKWAYDLATMMQISMMAYFTAGAAVSMSYYDLPYLFMGMVVAMEYCLAPVRAVAKPSPYPASWQVGHLAGTTPR